MDKVTHWQPGHTTHTDRQTTSIQWAMRWMLTSGNQRCDSSTDHWWQISCHDSFPRLIISELSYVRIYIPHIWFKDCTHDNWYVATMSSDVSLCSKLINCSICDCFVNPNDADVILTAHNTMSWMFSRFSVLLWQHLHIWLSLITVITRMMRSHRYFPQSVNYWAQRTAMVPATMTMTIGKAVGMMVNKKNYCNSMIFTCI